MQPPLPSRLAWFGPLPPIRSGVAQYNLELLPGLASKYQVDLFVDGLASDVARPHASTPIFSAHDFAWGVFAGVMDVAVMIAAIFWLSLRHSCDEGPPWRLLFGGFIGYFGLIHLVVFGDGRFHLPLSPVLVLVLYGGWFFANLRRATYSRAAVTLSVATVTVFAAIWVHEGFAAWDMLRKVTKPL
jgi:hypothetical protein